jgi:hypothetical protein
MVYGLNAFISLCSQDNSIAVISHSQSFHTLPCMVEATKLACKRLAQVILFYPLAVMDVVTTEKARVSINDICQLSKIVGIRHEVHIESNRRIITHQ